MKRQPEKVWKERRKGSNGSEAVYKNPNGKWVREKERVMQARPFGAFLFGLADLDDEGATQGILTACLKKEEEREHVKRDPSRAMDAPGRKMK